MSVTTDLEQCWAEKTQREAVFTARAALENCTNNIEECHQKIQELVNSGSFDTIPTDLKKALNAWWGIVKTARTSIGTDGSIMSVFEWRP